MRKEVLFWILQLAGWGFYFGLSAYVINDSEGLSTSMAVGLLMMFLFTIGLTSAYRFLLIRWGWLSVAFIKTLPRAAMATVVISILLTTFDTISTLAIGVESSNLTRDIISGIISSSFLLVVWQGFYFAFHFWYKGRKEELKNLELEATRSEIELQNLKNQLNPHFMFNSLNSIRALIELDPSEASRAVTNLSSILRMSLQLGKKRLIPLHEELTLIERYLGMEKVRFESRLDYRIDVDPGLMDMECPPLMLQTLVENAIKHGISHLPEGGKVRLKASRNNGGVRIEVLNSGKLKDGVSDTGIGIVNVRKRLELLFGERAAFQLFQEGEYVKALINIDDESTDSRRREVGQRRAEALA